MLASRPKRQVVHGHQHAALAGLQAVAHIRQRAVHDRAHRVGEVALAKFLLDGLVGHLLVVEHHRRQRSAGLAVPVDGQARSGCFAAGALPEFAWEPLSSGNSIRSVHLLPLPYAPKSAVKVPPPIQPKRRRAKTIPPGIRTQELGIRD